MLRDLICGPLFLEFFGFSGFYWKQSTLYLDGEIGLASIRRIFGTLFRYI